MRFRILTMMIVAAVLSAVVAQAQTGLEVNSFFDGRFHSDRNATETVIRGGRLRDYDLSVYHGLTVKQSPAVAAEIEKAVLGDARNAVSREVNYSGGRLYYGFYELPRYRGERRYLFFLNDHLKGGNKVILIYMQGNAVRETIKKMLKK